ncbi:NAD(P)/FAD-dependent oxidoreductase [Hoyosella sp. YIM 151337]|uniref:phytoene desaturase family protein n=1 Tax=Hoyosella sp. YIM 151337 TaxID=2992742 RepID=UPI0022365FD7|nr:NAD(P)/FAD-dependent oxidoreductase [Hoyosella sp. YIM 151337]MCW4354255.1 NAD(P)/FAD-dependent oxidoreductase [Hoyosella sp. YIM 151337]
MSTAVVVGSGPNGLAAAVSLAAEGVQVTVLEAADEIGGGTRTSEGIVPGLLHDHCAAIHPMAASSRFITEMGLSRYGLRWRRPEIDCVHPLDDGSAGVLHRSVSDTAAGLGGDGRRWTMLFERPVANFAAISDSIMQPVLRVPDHPLAMARFGAPTALPASALARVFRTEQGRALFGGVAAHAFRPLHYPLTSAIGMGILTAGHYNGWVVAEGGTQTITNAMARLLEDLGGKIETGVRVDSLSQLPKTSITMFDLAPDAIARIVGDRLPQRISRAFTRFRRGPGAFKVDFAIEGGVPWRNPDAHRAGTVHLAGTYKELAATERDIHAGRMPAQPFVLVGQQYLADPQRSAGTIHPLWTYAHVPHGYTGDATEAIIAQIERFAPGFRDRIAGFAVRSATEMARYNPNFTGGDILTGAKDIRQLMFGPRGTLKPYSIGVPGMYVCSAATPPGPGAHGMCGYNAARAALAHVLRTDPRTTSLPGA